MIQVIEGPVAACHAVVGHTGVGLGKTIHIDVNPSHVVEIDGALVARGLGLEVSEFQLLMERRQVTVLCERGTGEPAGLYRASFYHDGRRVRLVVDCDGKPVRDTRTTSLPGRDRPG